MKKYQKHIMQLFLLLLIFINISYMAEAEGENFGISLDCLDSCKEKNIDYSEDIIFVLTISNNFDYWVSLGSENNINPQSTFLIKVENINLKETNSESHKDILGKRVFLKPRSELKIYIPFDKYNTLGKDNRLGEWQIYPELKIENVKFYKNPFELKDLPYSETQYLKINPTTKGNLLKFITIKPETEIQNENSENILNQGTKETIKEYITEIIVGVISLVSAGIILHNIKKR